MTTKIMTVRLPLRLYSELCSAAGEAGIPISTHIRQLVEREHRSDAMENMRNELLQKLDGLSVGHGKTSSDGMLMEILLLARAIAADRNPQLIRQVNASLAQSGVTNRRLP